MLPYLTRVSLWLAALAAAASLFTPGQQGALLAAVGMVTLIVALLLRRFHLKAAPLLPAMDPGETPGLDDAAMLDVAAMFVHAVADASSLVDALRDLRDALIHELGAQEVTLHEPPEPPHTTLVVPERYPLGPALKSGNVTGSIEAGFALPVACRGRIVAMLELKGTEIDIGTQVLGRLLELAKVQLDALAEREAPEPGPLVRVPSPLGHDGEFFNVLAENLPVSLFVFELAERRLLAINRHAELEFGLRRHRVIGKPLAEAFGKRLAALTEPAMLQAVRDGTTVDVDCEWTSRQGGWRTVNVRNVVLRHADGTPRLLIALARETTVERRNRRELEESQARIAELAETMDDTLFVSNLDRSHYDFLGGSAFDTFGVTRERFDQRHAALLEHVLDEDRALLEARRQAEMRQEPADITYRIGHPQKGIRWIRSRSRTRALPDGKLRVYGLVSDVTRDREHEGELERARDEAEAASLAKSQFMANMSHEIRTPMNGILGMTELLMGTPLNDKQGRFAKAVYRSGESLLEIINDILDFSKIEAGKLELAPTDFSLRGVVEDTLELLAPRAHEKGLELSFHEVPGLPTMVHGDPLRLRQVLTNLVANAIKFTECGEVVVDLRPDDSPASTTGAIDLLFNVRDTGIGIDTEVLPRLFSAFT
ncbi:MAG TPA: histidine kinase dimerization/phospho-acceptor domain-containing protein, partial [Albitalea sp.]|nr:histidine kinase dimerization/phospho-acceptor domain-containing protein [Albitalea sp.]